MVKRILVIVFCLILSVFAQDDLQQFKDAFEQGDYSQAYQLGGALCKAYPDDAIIRLQVSSSAFIVGDFKGVLEIAEQDSSIPLLPVCYNKIEDMGFDVYSFYVWMNQIQASAALKQVDEALTGLALAEKYENRPLLFLEYLLFLHQGRTADADVLQKKWFPLPYDDVSDGELFAKRIIPAMREPDNLEHWMSTAASYDEMMLLLACCGFRDWLDGNRERGLDRMKRAVREGNPGSAGIAHVLLELCLPDGEAIQSIVEPGLRNSRWQKQASSITAYYEAYTDCDWPQVQHHLAELISLSPQDIDYQAIRMIIQLVQGQFREAGQTADAALKNVPWDTNNVLCMRLYRPLIHLLLNEQEAFRTSLADLDSRDLPIAWRRAVDVIQNPDCFSDVNEEFSDDPDKLCMPMVTRALLAETDGDYILAETLYTRFITEKPFFKFLEFYLADARLKIIAPLAALQRIEMKETRDE